MKLTAMVYINLRKRLLIIPFLFIYLFAYNQVIEKPKVQFLWIDNAFKTEKSQYLYIIDTNKKTKDTLSPSFWQPATNDTLIFSLSKYHNPVHLEMKTETSIKKSNAFNLNSSQKYTVYELSDSLIVKSQVQVFDNLDNHFKLLYAFLIKLLTELLLTIPVIWLFRLPKRLIFFVFVANIMSFPINYAFFLTPNLKELVSLILEGLFIYLIGWKRLKVWKALTISLILNILRFGISKIIILIIKYF